ncbi:DUF2533 family protein [Fictibacillus enclensis]|uniref:DUF2533 domain-containing protein n=1 Tax=Fictibacillus enclensis TaxID=1017270 RepID=A0A0V8JDL9_9BACL|nr:MULTISPECIES: DUF2533 family protein [Fictibacillus]KSU85238.1 hypothetical protein AS030_06920 [Fictibacillus enclensis]MDM5199070.1 DUF2533 family protein [Fictibacillus enclensis]MDM5338253.1 DUF2533 family protein [Fictibacillus enclensis]RXY99095.1 DUF2533 domain-containing protein [Fictibacillus sp. S7]
MMSVHLEISKHSSKQHEVVAQFLRLEQIREQLIEEAVERCSKQEPFSVKEINDVSRQMNQLAQKGIVPQRKMITEDMVKEYVDRKKNQASD